MPLPWNPEHLADPESDLTCEVAGVHIDIMSSYEGGWVVGLSSWGRSMSARWVFTGGIWQEGDAHRSVPGVTREQAMAFAESLFPSLEER